MFFKEKKREMRLSTTLGNFFPLVQHIKLNANLFKAMPKGKLLIR